MYQAHPGSFQVSLTSAPDGIANYVHAFALAGAPKVAANIVQAELNFLCNGERDSEYRYRKGSRHVACADCTPEAIERRVLPGDPVAVFSLLTTFIENEERISENCWGDGFGASRLFKRARELTERVTKALPGADAEQALHHL